MPEKQRKNSIEGSKITLGARTYSHVEEDSQLVEEASKINKRK